MGRLIASRPVAAASTEVPAQHGDLTRLARGGALNLVGGVVNGAFGFLLVVVLTRGLHGGAAGAFFEAIAIFSIAGATAAFGADVGLVRTIARMRARSGTADVRGTLMVALVPIGVAGAVAGACVFGFAEPLARAFGRGVDQAVTAQYLRVLAPFIPVLALRTPPGGHARVRHDGAERRRRPARDAGRPAAAGGGRDRLGSGRRRARPGVRAPTGRGPGGGAAVDEGAAPPGGSRRTPDRRRSPPPPPPRGILCRGVLAFHRPPGPGRRVPGGGVLAQHAAGRGVRVAPSGRESTPPPPATSWWGRWRSWP